MRKSCFAVNAHNGGTLNGNARTKFGEIAKPGGMAVDNTPALKRK